MTTPPNPGSPTEPGTVTRLPQQRASSAGGGSERDHAHAVHGSLALSYTPVTPPPPPPPVAVSDADAEVRVFAGGFAQAAIEVVAGQRPVLQMLRWTDEHVYADLERRAAAAAQARGTSPRRLHAQVRSVHVCRPQRDVAEVSVHVRHGQRSRALALRLERHRDRWRCTVLQFG